MESNLYHYKFSPWTVKGDKRIVGSEAAWKKPAKWNKEAAAQKERPRALVPVDVFEDWQGRMRNAAGLPLRKSIASSNEWVADKSLYGPEHNGLTMQDVRRRLFSIIDATPHLDWLLVTERPENVTELWPGTARDYYPNGWPNLWLGVHIENQEQADKRITHLLQTPAAVRFLSCEPLLEPIEFIERFNDGATRNFLTGQFDGIKCKGINGHPDFTVQTVDEKLAKIHWVIVGGESGSRSRPCNIAWIRSIVQQCKAAGVPVFVKQLGACPMSRNDEVSDWFDECNHLQLSEQCENHQGAEAVVEGLRDRKGGDPSEWPADLRVRELPEGRTCVSR